MTTRDELIEAGAQAYLLRLTGDNEYLAERIDEWDRGVAEAILTAVLPLVTAAIAGEIESRVTPMPMAVPHSVIVSYAAEIAHEWVPA